MRTTVTLDPDEEARRPFVQQSFSLGVEQNFRLDKALVAAEAMEDEELIRKLAMRK